MTTVAALYVDPRGPYPSLFGPENCWDEERDARLYEGPDPVVAHPPCGPWSALKHLYRGAGRELALRALEQVRTFGGVLEHPATSGLWAVIGASRVPGDSVLAYDQVEFGHPARKSTLLYCVGVPESARERPPFVGRQPTHWCSGGGTGRGKTPPGIKVCSAQQRRRTPPLFAEYLVRLARSVKR